MNTVFVAIYEENLHPDTNTDRGTRFFKTCPNYFGSFDLI
jgi:hypothetical protein